MKKRLLIIILAVLALGFMLQLLPGSNIALQTVDEETRREFLQEINRTVKAEGLEITVTEVFLDLNTIYVNGTARGKEKIVALEVTDKNDPEAADKVDGSRQQPKALPGTELEWGMHGLWSGGKWWHPAGDRFSVRFPHGLDLSQPGFNMVFYTSQGEKVVLEMPVKENLKDKVRVVPVNWKADLEGKRLEIREISFGLTYTAVQYQTRSSFAWRDMEFTLTDLTTGKTYRSAFGSLSGDGEKYTGEAAFEDPVPLPEGPVELKVRSKEGTVKKQISVVKSL